MLFVLFCVYACMYACMYVSVLFYVYACEYCLYAGCVGAGSFAGAWSSLAIIVF